MRDPLPHGTVIRKLWIGEADIYRYHLLRLDADSRRNRFAGAVSDEFVREYAELSFGIDALIHDPVASASQTASPRSACTLTIPVSPPFRRSAMHWIISRA